MKIVVDENMPKVADLFSDLAEIHYVDGRTLTNQQLLDADALLVRSVTKVNKALLEGSQIKFVGSATIGVDHIDIDYLSKQSIGFASAPGCNADAVADYVLSALSYLYEQKGVAWLHASIGVIGYGNVGNKVYQRLSALGCTLKVHDPFKQKCIDASLNDVNFVSLEELMSSNIIILHTPLTKSGDHPTKGMIDADMLKIINSNTCIISAGRGGVINEKALLSRYKELNGHLSLVFDVWDNEPNIDLSLMNVVDIATPHIAGYSLQGREKGTFMVYQAFCQYFNLCIETQYNDIVSQGAVAEMSLGNSLLKRKNHNVFNGLENPLLDSKNHDLYLKIARACHSIYNLSRDDSAMRRTLLHTVNEQGFDFLRKHYTERDEFSTCTLDVKNKAEFLALGFSVK